MIVTAASYIMISFAYFMLEALIYGNSSQGK